MPSDGFLFVRGVRERGESRGGTCYALRVILPGRLRNQAHGARCILGGLLLGAAACSTPFYESDEGGDSSGRCVSDACDGDAEVADPPDGGLPREEADSTPPRTEQDDASAAMDASSEREPEGGAPDGGFADERDGSSSGAWPEDILGTYAVHIRFYSYLESVIGRAALLHEVVYLAQIADEADGRVFMEATRCRDYGRSRLPSVSQEFVWRWPERLPAERFEVAYIEGEFRTEAQPRAIGYRPEAAAECSSNLTLPAYPDQTWLRSTCQCGNGGLPTSIDDCQVSDPDGDDLPGFTVDVRGDVTSGENYARTKDATQIVHGKLSSSRRHTAKFVENYDYLVMDCKRTASFDCGVAGGRVEPCPFELNPVSFEPLSPQAPDGAEWTCATVLEQMESGRLFATEMLSFPDSGC